MDTPTRTWVKAILWNIMGLVSMALVGLAVTGSFAVGGTLAVANTLVGLGCYVVYERVWSRINWGRKHG